MYRRDGTNRVHRTNGNGEYAVDHAKSYLGRGAQAEDQKNDRIERDLGNRIDGAEHRIGHIARKTIEADREAEQYAARDPDQARITECDAGTPRIVPEISRSQQSQ